MRGKDATNKNGKQQSIYNKRNPTVILHSLAMVEAKTLTPCVKMVNQPPPARPYVRVNPHGENGLVEGMAVVVCLLT